MLKKWGRGWLGWFVLVMEFALLSVSLCFPLTTLGSVAPLQPPAGVLSELIPESFPDKELSSYTIRYLSQSSSSADSEACLGPQPPQGEANSTLQSCSSVRYSLSGGSRTGITFFNISYLILLVSSGAYSYGNNAIKLMDISNVIIARNPLETDEAQAVFMCESKQYSMFNNLFFQDSENIAFLNMTFSNCGPYVAGLALMGADNTVIDNCTFKYVK